MVLLVSIDEMIFFILEKKISIPIGPIGLVDISKTATAPVFLIPHQSNCKNIQKCVSSVGVFAPMISKLQKYMKHSKSIAFHLMLTCDIDCVRLDGTMHLEEKRPFLEL